MNIKSKEVGKCTKEQRKKREHRGGSGIEAGWEEVESRV